MTSYESAAALREELALRKAKTENEILALKQELKEYEQKLYDVSIRELHLKEIYRQAAIQFSRLRKLPEAQLTKEDVAELEKWIGRAKSIDGIRDVVDALKELQKYSPVEIRSNLYALVQRIIIGGAYHRK